MPAANEDVHMPAQLPLSEDELRTLSKQVRSSFSSSCGHDPQAAVQRFESVLNSILEAVVWTEAALPHRTAACNALSALVATCLGSPHSLLRAQASRPDLCLRVCSIYLEMSDLCRAKPMRQILMSLHSMLLQDTDRPEKKKVKALIGQRLVSILLNREAHPRVKPAIQAMEYLVKKEELLVTDLVSMLQVSADKELALIDHESPGAVPDQHVVSHTHFQPLVRLLSLAILEWITYPDLAPAAGKLFVAFFHQLQKHPPDSMQPHIPKVSPPAWVEPLRQSISTHVDCVDALKQHVLPGMLALDRHQFVQLLRTLPWQVLMVQGHVEDTVETELLFACLQVGKELGLVVESESEVVGDGTMRDGMVVLSKVIKKLINRLRGGLSHTAREIERNKTLERKMRVATSLAEKDGVGDASWVARQAVLRGFERIWNDHVAFIQWYISFTLSELGSTSSYQRHVMALKAIIILLHSGLDERVSLDAASRPAQEPAKWPLHFPIGGPTATRLLLDLLVDPFEDVREASTEILMMIPAEVSHLIRAEDAADV
ncbi:MAG: hypothetical protein M1838_001311 [Thelocarpon superellum]|nr:MAG: hypothetical protein M1838_001311 [Thelocarpon superellum]